ncbi:MAG: FHA domain-containing protein [Ruminococcus flavefaciens]|nr:FHA domain-containing protein [Ruminococcus flavefaciens]
MALQQCSEGHLYDTDQHSVCPYCNNGTNIINFGGGDTVGKTVASSSIVSPAVSEIGSTVAPQSYMDKQKNETGKTVGVFQKKMKLEPVVGWLVCIEGSEKGKDFRIYGKNNTIGRSDKMDICIKSDMTISRENHARLAYDEKHNGFHLIPAESSNTIYLNEEPIYIPVKLNARDIIEFGECKFLFVPLCDESFSWKKNGD